MFAACSCAGLINGIAMRQTDITIPQTAFL